MLLLDSLHNKCSENSPAVILISNFMSTLFSTLKNKDITFTAHQPTDYPCQVNGDDCGIFICLYAKLLCNGKGRMPSGVLDKQRKEIYDDLLAATDKNVSDVNTVQQQPSREIIIRKTQSSILVRKTPPMNSKSTEKYLTSCVRSYFKTSYGRCLLGANCLRPKYKKMILCEICREWAHKECVNDVNFVHEDTSFHCNICKP